MPTHEDFPNNIPNPNTAGNAMQNYTRQYTYDELGNMQQVKSNGQWTRDYYYNFAANNYLIGHTENTTEYTYDQHGNMLTMPHLQALNWDYKDQLQNVELDASGNKAYYSYDAGGNRTRKVIEKGNIKEERYYLGDYEVYRKFVNGTLQTERTTVHVADDKKKIALVEKQTITESSLTPDASLVIRYQYDNHLGSASLELDESAEIISYEEYHPFGTTSYRSGRTETETSQKRCKYVGKERDEETGLYYYGARYYAAWICRFVSVDPLQHDYPQLTPYNYAGNKPIIAIDIDGMQGTKDKPEGKLGGTKYVNGNNRLIFETNDGSNDVVVVPKGHRGDFRAYKTMYENSRGMREYFDSKGFNDHQKQTYGVSDIDGKYLDPAGFSRKGLTNEQLSVVDMQYTNAAKRNLVNYLNDPTFSNGLKYITSAVAGTYTDPELIATGLSLALAPKPSPFKPSLKKVTFSEGGSRIWAYADNEAVGFYDFDLNGTVSIELNIPESLKGKGIGSQVFKEAVEDAISFKASWVRSDIYPTGISDNLATYEASLAKGLSTTEAAWSTWSGKQAAAAGFTKASVTSIDNGVQVIFTR